MLKVDVFILKPRRYDQEAFQRRRKDLLGVAPDSDEFYFATPEDIVLNKLEWFRMGNRVSERQWMDVMGVIKVQGDVLDVKYLRKWAKDLEVADLLEDALARSRHLIPRQTPSTKHQEPSTWYRSDVDAWAPCGLVPQEPEFDS